MCIGASLRHITYIITFCLCLVYLFTRPCLYSLLPLPPPLTSLLPPLLHPRTPFSSPHQFILFFPSLVFVLRIFFLAQVFFPIILVYFFLLCDLKFVILVYAIYCFLFVLCYLRIIFLFFYCILRSLFFHNLNPTCNDM